MLADKHTNSILGAVIICTLPHFLNVSIWAILICLFMWTYIFSAAKYSLNIPRKLTLSILSTIFFVVAMTTHEGFTIESFIALLALMANLKLMEVKIARDRIITVILCYFLIVSGLFFDDSILSTLYLLFAILLTTGILIHVNHPVKGFTAPIKLSGILMIQALPVALVLFLLFPRIQGGLWGRSPLQSAQTGFSDTMTLGNISKMVQNREVAFRVDFSDFIPPQNQLYWRGIVLWDFDGKTWRRGHKKGRGTPAPQLNVQQKIEYTVMLEPHNEHWLLTLDLPVHISFNRAWLNSDHTVYRWWPITQRVSYKVVSDLKPDRPHDNHEQQKALSLPETGNRKSRELAHSLAAKSTNTLEYIEQVLNYYREQAFSYTLQPPVIQGNNIIDQFLFNTRQGFCEHFAASFAFLMRAADVPARVVVGYQGGKQNPYGGYLVVRQSDAHAWCEVWLPEKGWIRIDPTSAIAPTRLAGSSELLPSGGTEGLLSFMRRGSSWFREITDAWDFLNSRWNNVVMGYSPNKSSNMFFRLGINIKTPKGLGQALLITMAAAIFVLACAVIFVQFLRHKKERDEIGNSWIKFCRKLEQAGLSRRPSQGPLAYLEYISQNRPDLTSNAKKIISSYIQLRYSDILDIDETLKFRQMVSRFSPSKKS